MAKNTAQQWMTIDALVLKLPCSHCSIMAAVSKTFQSIEQNWWKETYILVYSGSISYCTCALLPGWPALGPKLW